MRDGREGEARGIDERTSRAGPSSSDESTELCAPLRLKPKVRVAERGVRQVQLGSRVPVVPPMQRPVHRRTFLMRFAMFLGYWVAKLAGRDPQEFGGIWRIRKGEAATISWASLACRLS